MPICLKNAKVLLEECIFTIGKTIYAVGCRAAASPENGLQRSAAASGEEGAVLWRLELPDRGGPVTIADPEGNGTAEIVVGCADGHVYGIGPLVARR